jgi:hypothetical protein
VTYINIHMYIVPATSNVWTKYGENT